MAATKKRVAKKATKKTTKKTAKKAPAKRAAVRIPARADKGEGEAAVQARIKVLKEPSRSIITKLHRIVTKTAPSLDPSVKWGFAVYSRDGKMLLVASPYTKYARFGFTMDAAVKGETPWIEYKDASEIDEAKVVSMVKRVVG